MIPFILVLLCAQAQTKDAPKTQDPKVQERLDDQEDRIKDLERRLAETEKKQAQTTSANPATVFNPTLTVFGNFLWRYDDRKVFLDNNPAEPTINDTINIREVELDLRASVDPYVDGVAILAVESEVPGDFEVAVEEFYAVVKSLPLPFWESPPLGTKIKVGRFRTEFGLNNRTHLHDLPQSDRPLVVEEFLGPEGQVANGISTTSFLPSPGDTALELTLQALGGGNRLSTLANVNFFAPLADEHSLNVAAIGFYGENDPDDQSRVASLDVFYKWKPHREGQSNSFLLGGQLFYASHEFMGGRTHPFGATAWAQYQISTNLYAGVRWDQTETLGDDRILRRKLSGYFTWYTTEFFRARFTYEHVWSDLPIEDDLDSFFVELTVVIGAHPPHPFWVNK